MVFQNNNLAAGIPADSPIQIGSSDRDDGRVVERNVDLPWASDPVGSYAYYDCAVGVMLDSGIVVHNRLPQINNTADSLGSIDLADPNMADFIDRGVNLRSQDQYNDIVQRMGHSRYWIHLWGMALRIGYQVPIPKIVSIGGVPAIPYDKNPQWAFNKMFPGGNYGGVILWHAEWSLWYTTASPPVSDTFPAASPLVHTGAVQPPPNKVQSPYSQPDDEATAGGFDVGNGGKPVR